MAKLHIVRRFVVASMMLVTFVLPSFLQARKLPSSRKLSFELHLPRPPLNPHNATCMHQPLTPHLFSARPLFHSDETTHAHANAGSACGLYLADPAASMELRFVFFTASLQKYQGGGIAREEAGGQNDEEGSLVLMGSLGSGTISVVGGTRGFAFARGQAKVSMAPAGSSEELIIFFDVELQFDMMELQSEEEIAIS